MVITFNGIIFEWNFSASSDGNDLKGDRIWEPKKKREQIFLSERKIY